MFRKRIQQEDLCRPFSRNPKSWECYEIFEEFRCNNSATLLRIVSRSWNRAIKRTIHVTTSIRSSRAINTRMIKLRGPNRVKVSHISLRDPSVVDDRPLEVKQPLEQQRNIKYNRDSRGPIIFIINYGRECKFAGSCVTISKGSNLFLQRISGFVLINEMTPFFLWPSLIWN